MQRLIIFSWLELGTLRQGRKRSNVGAVKDQEKTDELV